MRVTGSVLSLTNNCCKLIVNNFKLNSYKKQHPRVLVLYNNQNLHDARYSTAAAAVSPKSQYITYEQLMQQKRSEAARSIIVQVQKENMCNDVYDYCSQFGKIKEIFHYTTNVIEYSQRELKHLVFIEFEDRKDVDAVISSATHIKYNQTMPATTTMLWYRKPEKNSFNKNNESNDNNEINQVTITKNSCKILNDSEIKKKLIQADSVSDQMEILYNLTKLNDAGTKLRFYTAYQIENCFKSLFPNIAVLPFGSSVNSFGKQGCDLDLCLILDQNHKEKPSSKLVFQAKYFSIQEKLHAKKLLETISECIKLFLPGISNLKQILKARVPIIKFDHLLCGIECDLAATNVTAYYMSELLYIYGESDWRVRPLTFTIRQWAKSLGITNNIPGAWITNFSLTLMVIFFLQQKNILPSLKLLQSKASKSDVRIADSHVDCTFLRDITILPSTKQNDSLEELLYDFFDYYVNFDFTSRAISLKLGKSVIKPENNFLYICNPLETSLNVSKNVNSDNLNKFVMAMRSSMMTLKNSNNKDIDSWGLINLFSNKIR